MKKPSFYREWLDSFFARDIQRLFGFRDMNRFNALFEYLLYQSGGQFEVTRTVERGSGSTYDETCSALVDLSEAYVLHASKKRFQDELKKFMASHMIISPASTARRPFRHSSPGCHTHSRYLRRPKRQTPQTVSVMPLARYVNEGQIGTP
jgi:hypothetical protein